MARIRTIKPEFFTSEDIVALSPMARLLYIATWCEADKEGRLSWKPKTFKMRYLPGDDCDIEAICAELSDAGLVTLYGNGLAHIPGFHKHQHVNPRESASNLPPPPQWTDPGPKKVGKTTREAVFERDGYRCVRCGSDEKLQADHILPQSCGGPHILENLRTLCRSCNAARPVAGQGLVDDLAIDGLTIESLRVKFGIDASIPFSDAQVGRKEGKEGKGKEKNELPPSAAVDPVSEMISGAVEFMGSRGVPEKQARSVVGMIRKTVGDDLVAAELLATAAREGIADPVPWLRAAANKRKSKTSDSAPKPWDGAL